MSQRYTIHFDGPNTSITSHPEGPWPRWDMARAAAVEHLERQVQECLETLLCLRRAGSFHEYQWLVGERAGAEADEVAWSVDPDQADPAACRVSLRLADASRASAAAAEVLNRYAFWTGVADA